MNEKKSFWLSVMLFIIGSFLVFIPMVLGGIDATYMPSGVSEALTRIFIEGHPIFIYSFHIGLIIMSYYTGVLAEKMKKTLN